ncbi:MAG: PQQ-dependent dehydrogenase, methanol/ethanol family, partial [Pseudomonas sp.]
MTTKTLPAMRPAARAVRYLILSAGLALSASHVAAKPVTWNDIANDHTTTHDVLMYGLGNNAQRYSPLSLVNDQNVFKLTPAWSFSFGD